MVEVTPPYKRKVELPFCCVPAVLQMVFERRGINVPEQEDIGYELSLIVPEEITPQFQPLFYYPFFDEFRVLTYQAIID
ncbi:hypothetical protein ES703_102869 [subsurface metagenome]